MQCNNIDIKKLQKFAILFKKLDWRKIENTKITTVSMTVEEFLKRREKNVHFYKKYTLKSDAIYDKNHPNYLTQNILVDCVINTKHAHNRMVNFLKKAFGVELHFDAHHSFYNFYHNNLLGLCKYFAQNKNIKHFTTFSYEIKEVNKGYNEVVKMLYVNFANSNFKLELAIL